MPNFPIIDSHVHLYDPGYLTYHWMKNVPRLNKPHLMTDFTRLTAGVEVDQIVFVEVDVAASQALGRSRRPNCCRFFRNSNSQALPRKRARILPLVN